MLNKATVVHFQWSKTKLYSSFAHTKLCQSCTPKAAQLWSRTSVNRALEMLESDFMWNNVPIEVAQCERRPGVVRSS